MSTLSNLKAKATEKLGTAHADVVSYITALESSARNNRVLAIICAVGGLVLGAVAGRFLKL
jgi:hypothetical protein